MIKAFEFGHFRLIGKSKDIPAMMAAVAASRGQFNRWQEERTNKAHSQDVQMTSRQGGSQAGPANIGDVK